MKKILFCLILMPVLAGCAKYDKLPSRTSRDETFSQPQGEVPTQAEKDLVRAMIEEHNEAVD